MVLERGKRIGKPPDIDLQTIQAARESFGIGDEKRQIEFSGNPEQHFVSMSSPAALYNDLFIVGFHASETNQLRQLGAVAKDIGQP